MDCPGHFRAAAPGLRSTEPFGAGEVSMAPRSRPVGEKNRLVLPVLTDPFVAIGSPFTAVNVPWSEFVWLGGNGDLREPEKFVPRPPATMLLPVNIFVKSRIWLVRSPPRAIFVPWKKFVPLNAFVKSRE